MFKSRPVGRLVFGVSLATFIGYCACNLPQADDAANIGGDVGVDSKTESDSEGANDLADATSQARDSTLDTDDTSADSRSDAMETVPIRFDASLWSKESPCPGVVTFASEPERFELPTRPSPSQPPVVNRDEFISDLPWVPSRASSVRVGNAVWPGEGWPFDLYTYPGHDVPFHVYVFNDFDNLSSSRLNVTVLVDYQPVEANYVRWNSDRTGKLEEMVGQGVNFDIESDFEVLDVTVPGEVFSENRAYEISIAFEVTSHQRRTTGHSRRFILYNGGYDRPTRPCAEPRLDDDFTGIEEALMQRIGDDVGVLFFDGISSSDDLRRVIDVQPGATHQLFYSVFRTSVQDGPKHTVMVPTLNGAPIGAPSWVIQGGETDEYLWHVDARKRFEVTFPEKPGIYEVQVMSWEDPYILWRDRDGNEVDGISSGGKLRQNTNALRFRVVE